MRRNLVLILSTLAISASSFAVTRGAELCATSAPGGDWPVFGHNLDTDRYQGAEHTITPGNVSQLKAAWVMPTDGSIESPAVVSGGCAFIATTSGHIYAVNAVTGELAWDTAAPGDGFTNALSIANGRVFAQVGTLLVALDEASGNIEWQRELAPIPNFYAGGGSPLAFEDMVVAGVVCPDDTAASAEHPRGSCRGPYGIYDQATGAPLYTGYDTSDADFEAGMGGAGFWGQPAYDRVGRYIYLGNANARTYAPENPLTSALLKIDADRSRPTFGKIVDFYSATSEGQNLGNTPVGDELCTRSNGFQFCTGDDDFVQPAMFYNDSYGNRRIGIGHSQSELPLSQDWIIHGLYESLTTDLDEVWRARTNGARSAAGAYDGSYIYAALGGQGFGGWGSTGGMIAINKNTGAIVWQAPTFGDNSWRHISGANGVIYTQSGGDAAGGNPGLLMAYDARSGGLLAEIPMAPDVQGLAKATAQGGITIARGTVMSPTNTTGGNGYLIGYRLPEDCGPQITDPC